MSGATEPVNCDILKTFEGLKVLNADLPNKLESYGLLDHVFDGK